MKTLLALTFALAALPFTHATTLPSAAGSAVACCACCDGSCCDGGSCNGTCCDGTCCEAACCATK